MFSYERISGTIITLVFFCVPQFTHAETLSSDLNLNNVPDETEEEVVVTTPANLIAGEYNFKKLVVASSTILTLTSDPSAAEDFKGVRINAQTVIVNEGSVITANGTGYTLAVRGPGSPTGTSRGGASHGGSNSDNSVTWYGSSLTPRTLGSAGRYKGGGGAIEIHAASMTVEGTISSEGTESASGGSILLFTEQFSGSGVMSVRGGKFYTSSITYQPGAGGRIAVHSTQNEFTGTIDIGGGIYAASGGVPTRYAPSGTLAFFDTDTNTLIINNSFRFQENDEPHQYNAVVITGTAEMAVSSTVHSDEVLVDGGQVSMLSESRLETESLEISGVGVMTLRGGVIAPTQSIVLSDTAKLTTIPMNPLVIETDTLEIEAGATVSASGAGYAANGPGSPTSLTPRAGASYGGLGTGASASSTYGDAATPIDFGSGTQVSNSVGGGVLSIITELLIVDGTVEANGNASASGGSVLIHTNSLSGTGKIEANGGNFGVSAVYHGAGGGGRVAVNSQSTSTWSGTVKAAGGRNVSSSGSPITYAGDGTVVLNQVKKGASSVLFLPGIQASHLYKENFFGEGVDQVWPPNAIFNEDIYDLSMSSTGVSEEPIYTEDIIDTTAGVGSIYGGLTFYMNQLKSDQIISDWKSYAYDWRYSVTDVAQNGTQYKDQIKDAVTEIETLAASSLSGKVAIIGHSNGGLLAKAIAKRLETEGKLHLIDKIVLLASPQTGTPKAIGTILHGYDQTDNYVGVFMDGHIVRKVTNNLPGAYGLLPTEKYFEGLDNPLIRFADTSVTAPYRQTYGTSITSYGDYVRFVRGEDSFDRDLDNPISTPTRANAGMLNDALGMHDSELDDWVAPNGIEVIEVVGTGLPTMKAIEYREVLEDKCLIAGPVNVCSPVSEIKPYAVLTKYGDGTVVQRSAEGYGGEKRKFFVDLQEVKRSYLTPNYVHYNITEAPPVQELLRELIIGTTTNNNQFISTSHTEFNDAFDVEMIDSPVRLLATDQEGNQTGIVIEDGKRMIKQEIPGSQYFEFGDTKYFIVPKNTNRTTRLYGEELGGYTLTTATLDSNDTQIVETILQNASTSPTMIAEYSNTNNEYSTVATDSNGDGTIDIETTLDGEVIEEEVLTGYPLLIRTIESINLYQAYKEELLVIIKTAEYYGKSPQNKLNRKAEDAALKSAKELIKTYVKKKYIAHSDAAILQEMIEVLKDKQ